MGVVRAKRHFGPGYGARDRGPTATRPPRRTAHRDHDSGFRPRDLPPHLLFPECRRQGSAAAAPEKKKVELSPGTSAPGGGAARPMTARPFVHDTLARPGAPNALAPLSMPTPFGDCHRT